MTQSAEVYVKFSGLLSVTPQIEEGLLSVQLRSEDNKAYYLDFPESILGVLITALMTQVAYLKPSGKAQTFRLTNGREFIRDDGQPGLELTLEDTVRLPVVFDSQTMAALRTAIGRLEDQITQTPPEQTQH